MFPEDRPVFPAGLVFGIFASLTRIFTYAMMKKQFSFSPKIILICMEGNYENLVYLQL